MSRPNVLIIKHGFSETCDQGLSRIVSYGDVFRCTCLLEDFRDSHVTWITSVAARDLLVNNPLLDRLILADTPADIPADGLAGKFDTVINLEKQPDWCDFAAALPAQAHYGFKDWQLESPDCFYRASAAALSAGLTKGQYRPLQETLFESVGREWVGQRYSLGYRPRNAVIYDIGLNYAVGPKWPTKAWPKKCWQELHDRLADRYVISWQQSLNSVRHYIEWLNACRLIVTTDSLGLHLALGLHKRTVALFGPTPPEQVYMYGYGVKLTPVCQRDCVPCFQDRCAFGKSCMEYIDVDMVIDAVETLLPRPIAAPPEPALTPA